MKSWWKITATWLALVTVLIAGQAGDGKWLRRVPDEERVRMNPVARQAQAEAAGKALFEENCAKCHGADADGRTHGATTRPSLRSVRVRRATDGELAWMLKHGDPYAGMPPWESLPELKRWQIIAYLRTLPPGKAAAGRAKGSGSPM